MSFAISCECWNSAQSILMTAFGSPKRTSAAASTTRVLPEPVGPRKSIVPTGRVGGVIPAGENWERRVRRRCARARGPEEEHRAAGAVRRVHPGEENLVEAAHAAHRALLADDARGELILELR